MNHQLKQAACPWRNKLFPRDHRLHDISPCGAGMPLRNRPGGSQVCRGSISTDNTLKVRAASRPFFFDPTARTGSGSSVSWNIHDINSSQFGLVLREGFELAESPTINHSVQFLAEPPGFCSYSLEILEDQGGSVAHRLANQRFADTMVQVAHPTRLPAGKQFQSAFGALRAFALEFRSTRQELLAFMQSILATEELALGSDSKVVDSSVDTDGADWANALAGFNINHDVDTPVTPSEDNLGSRRGFAGQFPPLKITKPKRNVKAPANTAQRDLFLVFTVGEGSSVVLHAGRAKLFDCAAFLSGSFHGPGGTSNSLDCKVGWEFGCGANRTIGQMVDFKLVGGGSLLPSFKGQHSCLGKKLKSLSERGFLRSGREHFADHCSLHTDSLSYMFIEVKNKMKGKSSPPTGRQFPGCATV